MYWGRIFLGFNALIWLGYASYLFLFPQQSANGSLSLDNSTAISDVMATYGGLQGAIGIMMFWGALQSHARQAAIWVAACAYGSLGCSRLLSIFITGDQSLWSVAGTSFELLSATAAIYLLKQLPKPVIA